MITEGRSLLVDRTQGAIVRLQSSDSSHSGFTSLGNSLDLWRAGSLQRVDIFNLLDSSAGMGRTAVVFQDSKHNRLVFRVGSSSFQRDLRSGTSQELLGGLREVTLQRKKEYPSCEMPYVEVALLGGNPPPSKRWSEISKVSFELNFPDIDHPFSVVTRGRAEGEKTRSLSDGLEGATPEEVASMYAAIFAMAEDH